MFETQTFEVILARMFETIPDDLDKREGSFIYNALAPAASEMAQMYIEFDNMMDETFGDTASREYLIRLCAERGITPYQATKTVLQGTFTPSLLAVPIGARFNCTNGSYIVTEKIADGSYKLQCEEAGIVGNAYTGAIIPIDYIEGLETAVLSSVLIYGEDEEATEDLRTRYFASFDEKAFSGNKQDYKVKTLAIPGVGAVKIFPVWNGAGTVKLVILDSVYGKATPTLITTVQTTFDPLGDGKGDGLAPIGHIVTIDTCTEVTVNLSFTLTYDTGYNYNNRIALIQAAMQSYMLELRTSWQEQTNLIVRIAQIEARLVAIEGILDVSNTQINGIATNLTLVNTQIPILGVITVA